VEVYKKEMKNTTVFMDCHQIAMKTDVDFNLAIPVSNRMTA